MNEQIRAILLKKQNQRDTRAKRLLLQDVNRDLIVALLAIPVYGKDARDEDILSIIINPGSLGFQKVLEQIKSEFDSGVKAKELKKAKDGFIRNKEGFIRLTPR